MTLKELKEETNLEIEYFKNLKNCVSYNPEYENRKIFLEMMVGEKDPEIIENYEIREKEIKKEKEKGKKIKKIKNHVHDEMRSDFSQDSDKDSDNSDNKSENEVEVGKEIIIQENYNIDKDLDQNEIHIENAFGNKRQNKRVIQKGNELEYENNKKEIKNKNLNVSDLHEMEFNNDFDEPRNKRKSNNENYTERDFIEKSINSKKERKNSKEKRLKKLNQENDELMDVIEALAEEKNILIDNIQKYSKNLNKSKFSNLDNSTIINAELSILESKMHHQNSNLYNILKNKETEIERLKKNLIKLEKRHKAFVIKDYLDWEIDNVNVAKDAKDCVEMTKMSVYSEDLTEGFQNSRISRISDFGRSSLANQFKGSAFGNFGISNHYKN